MSASLSRKSGVFNSDDSGLMRTDCKTEILFRVWTGDNHAGNLPSPESGGNQGGLVAFLQDVVSSRKGALVSTEENLYVSVLENASDAIVVARQVQLGMQEFKKKSRIQPVAVSIAIDAFVSNVRSSETDADKTAQEIAQPQAASLEASHDLLTLIRMSKPAQVLLTHELLQKASLFSGLPLKAFQGRFGVFEYLWTSEESLLELEDEQARFSESELSSVIRSDQGETVALPNRAIPDAIGRLSYKAADSEKSDAESKSFWGFPLIVSAVGLLLVILIGGGIVLRSKGPKTVPPAPQVIQRVAPASTENTRKVNAAEPAAPRAKADEKRRKASRPSAVKTADSEVPAGNAKSAVNSAPVSELAKTCELQGRIDDYLRQAEYDRGRGDYTSAERLFSGVLDCDPNNERAKLGLTRTRAAKK